MLEIVKRLFKALTKFQGKRHQYFEPRVHPGEWWSLTIFDQSGNRNKIFCMQQHEMETKQIICFEQARCISYGAFR